MAVWPEIIGPTWVEVDLDAIAHNTHRVKRYVGTGCRVMAMVQNDAAGRGAVEVARVVTASGADYLGVNTLPEALELRSGGIMAPILVLTPVEPREAPAALEARLTLTVIDTEGAAVLAKAANEAGLQARVHVRVDSGAGGHGLPAEEALRLLAYVDDQAELDLEGLYTHLSTSRGKALLRQQLDRFRALRVQLEERQIRVPLIHAADGPVLLAEPEAHLKMVRVGSLIYGEAERSGGRPARKPAGGKIDLHETLRIRARVTQVKRLKTGQQCCDGFAAKIPLTVAIVAVDDAAQFVPASNPPRARIRAWLLSRIEPLLEKTGTGWRPRRQGAVRVELHARAVRILGKGGPGALIVDASGLEGAVVGDEAVLYTTKPINPRLAKVYYRHDRPYKARTLLGEFYFHSGDQTWSLERTAEGEIAAGLSD